MTAYPVNHGRLHLISGAIRIIFGMRYSYPDFTKLLITADFDEIWCRQGRQGRAVEAQGKSSRSSTIKTRINWIKFLIFRCISIEPTPILVIYPSRRRTSRSAARRFHPSTLLRFLGLHYHSVLTTWVTTIHSHRCLARTFSTRPLRRHSVLLHCHRILPRLQTILQHLIIVSVIFSYTVKCQVMPKMLPVLLVFGLCLKAFVFIL